MSWAGWRWFRGIGRKEIDDNGTSFAGSIIQKSRGDKCQERNAGIAGIKKCDDDSGGEHRLWIPALPAAESREEKGRRKSSDGQ